MKYVIFMLLVTFGYNSIAGSSDSFSTIKLSKQIFSPKSGIICDKYFCASNNEGVSNELTENYLGVQKAKTLKNSGDFDRSEFTFSNGIFCDIKEKLCRKNRYYDANGKRSRVNEKYTKVLFANE